MGLRRHGLAAVRHDHGRGQHCLLSSCRLYEPHGAVIDGAWRVECAATGFALPILAGIGFSPRLPRIASHCHTLPAPLRSSRARLAKSTAGLGWRHTSLNPIPSQPARPKRSATAPPRGQRSADASPQRAPVAVKSRQPFDAPGTPAPQRSQPPPQKWAPPRPRKMRNRASPHHPTGPSCARATTSWSMLL